MNNQNSAKDISRGSMASIMKIYMLTSLILGVIFALVGLIFLFMADGVLIFFNTLSARVGMAPAPVSGMDFYLILAAGYMYIVTVLAFKMYRHPDNAHDHVLLIQAKGASSLLSILLMIIDRFYLIYLANAVVDGAIAVLLLFFLMKLRPARA